jgi:hypothetical protein
MMDQLSDIGDWVLGTISTLLLTAQQFEMWLRGLMGAQGIPDEWQTIAFIAVDVMVFLFCLRYFGTWLRWIMVLITILIFIYLINFWAYIPMFNGHLR